MESLKAYQYRRLRTAGQFRLLEVQARKKSSDSNIDSWRLQLKTLSRKYAPKYETVSYTWGDSKREHAVKLVDGNLILATSSVLTALPRLAANRSTGYLWIDQICINQDDVAERNMQVSVMGDIYKKCERVIIWLGDEDIDPTLSKLISDSYIAAQNRISSTNREFPLTNVLAQLLHTHFSESLSSCTEATARFYQRPWFTRGWVVQEALLPKDSTVLAGSTKPIFEQIALFAAALSILGSHKSRMHPGLTNLINMNIARQEHSSKENLAFHDHLSLRSSNVEVSDKRDLVYAFLGFLDDERINISVDYETSVEQVFIETAKAIITGRLDLELFGCLRPIPPGIDALNIPSWVPDWSRAFQGLPISRGELFRSAKDYKCSPVFLASSITMGLQGRVIDEIRFIMEPRFSSNPSSRKANLRLQMPFEAVINCFDQVWAGADHLVTRERLMKVFFADGVSKVEPDNQPLSPEKIEFLLSRYDAITMAENDSEVLWDLYTLEEYLGPHRGRYVFYTASGKLGLGIRIVQPGDQIAVIHGSRTPLILRPQEIGKFKLMGECYVEDVMYGEACVWDEYDADMIFVD